MRLTAILFLVSTLLISCYKTPTPCIDASATEVDVFEEVIFTSCSEGAAWYDWNLEYDAGVYYDINSSFSYSWRDPGYFRVALNVQNEKMNRGDWTETYITVNDICYECKGISTATVCGSDHTDKATFNATIQNFEKAGYTCVLINN